jgi:hypothetical protein
VAIQIVKVEGTDQLRDAAARLKAAGRTDLQRALTKAIRKSTADAVDDARETVRGLDIDGHDAGVSERAATARHTTGRGGGARARLEHQLSRAKDRERAYKRAHLRAGLREATARATTPKIKVNAASVYVRIRVNRAQMPPDQTRLPRYMNKGEWRHPVFGDRDVWVSQSAPPGWFDTTLAGHSDDIRAAIGKEIGAVMAQL